MEDGYAGAERLERRMDENIKLGFEFARDLTNQLITLSTGLLAFTVTFSKDLLKNLSKRLLYLLGGAWVLHVLSIGFGIFTIMTLTGTLLAATDKHHPKMGDNVLIAAELQQTTFVAGTLLLAVYGVALARKGFGPNDPLPQSGLTGAPLAVPDATK
jgi:hypothetical protein